MAIITQYTVTLEKIPIWRPSHIAKMSVTPFQKERGLLII